MKALTLTQPWASLMALQQKRIETRSWYTSFRGEMVIHAAKGFPRWAKDVCEDQPFLSALGALTAATLPLSRGLCVVRLLGCFPTTQMHRAELALGHKPPVSEIAFGDYTAGRFAWVTEYVRPLDDERIVRGALGLWEWPEQ